MGTARAWRQLLNLEADLSTGLLRRDGIAIEHSAEELDNVQRLTEREVAVISLDQRARTLRAVRAALRRMDEGSYGVCLECEEPISPKRLAAVPWAAYCVRCQDLVDRRAGDVGEPQDALAAT